MPNPMPATLRLYRRLAVAAGPLTPLLLKRRLKQGKEDPARINERRGVARQPRPAGPLVWIHGASVGEVLAAAALIERREDGSDRRAKAIVLTRQGKAIVERV
ncbi:MAG TPA: glycosyltransferase N-terminal domain-containing protein, partial [Nitrobacter sp.]|nr:glycosyltransferase N-terminal domain-containing protein [Nitrobacter sp.]